MGDRDDAAPKALDARAMRQSNLSLVLRAVVRQAPVSQPELVETTGLKKPTVNQHVVELVRLGWVRPQGVAHSTVGRPRQLFGPDPGRGLVVSLRISVDGLSALAAGFGGAEHGRRTEAVDVPALSQAHAVESLVALLRGLLGDLGADRAPVLGTSLALPGIVDAHGQLGYAPGLDWPVHDVGTLLRAAAGAALPAGTPLLVENEANLGAIGEQRYGGSAAEGSFIYVLGEEGVGAGVVIDGRLFRGSRGAGGEVGHVSIDLAGLRCRCGKRGCWAMYVSQDRLVQSARRLRAEGRSSSLWSSPSGSKRPPRLTPGAVLAAAAEGDRAAAATVRELRRYLAAGIGNLVSVYDPEAVVLGGFLSAAFAADLDGLRSEVNDWLMGGGGYTDLTLQVSTVPDASLWGGVALVHDLLLLDPRAAPTDAERSGSTPLPLHRT